MASTTGTLTTSYSYDANGNLTSGAGRTVSWTAADMVASITARHQAYRRILARSYRAELNGLAMQRGNRADYARPDCYVIDDWR